ncbi:hypothetical protein V6R21_07705 [Limibacter armeniacum]|uniref:hypothetical protein n=1 Tax=Limibacter armeniacum TaxID=466084 RepID=UPI002FE5C5BB
MTIEKLEKEYERLSGLPADKFYPKVTPERRLKKLQFKVRFLTHTAKAATTATLATKQAPTTSKNPTQEKLLKLWRELKAEFTHLRHTKLISKKKVEREYASLRILQIQKVELPRISEKLDRVKEGKPAEPERPITMVDISSKIEVKKRIDTVETYVSRYRGKKGKEQLFDKYLKELEYLKSTLK